MGKGVTAKTALQAYRNRLIVERTKAESKVGGIYITDGKRPTSGRIVSIGTEVKDVVIGDTIHYSQFSGIEFERDGKTLVILSVDDVLATER